MDTEGSAMPSIHAGMASLADRKRCGELTRRGREGGLDEPPVELPHGSQYSSSHTSVPAAAACAAARSCPNIEPVGARTAGMEAV